MGKSSYNNTNTGFGASTAEGSRIGYTSIVKNGTKNINFNVGGSYTDLKCRNRDGFEFLRNGINSIKFDTSGGEINWIQPKLTEQNNSQDTSFTVYGEGGSISADFQPFHLFDENSYSYGNLGNTADGSYTVLYNPAPFKITNLVFSGVYENNTSKYGLTHILVQGSNDLNAWTTLADVNVADASSPDITLSSTGYYKYYKVSGNVASGGITPIYATCNITAKLKINTITNDKYNIFIPEEGNPLFETGEFYRQPSMPYNVIKYGSLKEEINKTENPDGSLKVSSYLFSSFSASNYLKLPDVFDVSSASNWEIYLCIKTPSARSNKDMIIGPSVTQDFQGIALFLNSDGKLVLDLSSNGTSWNIVSTASSAVLATDTLYYIRIKFNGSKYTLEISTNDTDFSTILTVTSSTKLYKPLGTILLGCSLFSNAYYRGNMDLYRSYIKINGNYFWRFLYDGTIWEDTSSTPIRCRKYNLSKNIWNDYNNIYLGYIELTNGAVSGVKNEPFNSKNINVPNNIKPSNITESGIISAAGNFYNTSWYNLYSDGWLEQGVNFDQTASGSKTLTFYKPFRDANYNVASSGAVTGVTKSNDKITIKHSTGTGDLIASGYIASSKVVRKYYKYIYSTWTQPKMTSNGTFGGNTMAIEISYSRNNSRWGDYNGFSPNTGRIGFYCDEYKGNMTISIYVPVLLKLTNFSFRVPYASWGDASSAAVNCQLYSGDSAGAKTTTLKNIGTVWDNNSYSTSIDTPYYRQYYTFYAENQGGAHNDELEMMSFLLQGTARTVVESTVEDYDYYVDVEG